MGVTVGVELSDGEGLELEEGVRLGEGLRVTVGVGVELSDGEGVGEEEAVGLGEGERVGVGLGLGERLLEGVGVTVGVGVGVGIIMIAVGVGVGEGRFLIAYSAAPIISPLVLSIVVVSTRPFSSMPSTYPVVGDGRRDSTYEAMLLVKAVLYIANMPTETLKKITGGTETSDSEASFITHVRPSGYTTHS